jgi:hypothetical protein
MLINIKNEKTHKIGSFVKCQSNYNFTASLPTDSDFLSANFVI